MKFGKMIPYVLFGVFTLQTVFAQQSFTVDEAVAYGIANSINQKNASLGISDAEMQIKELKASGLPQISGQFAYTYNAIVPTQLMSAKNFNPAAADGEVTKFKFGVPYGGQAGIALSQLVFDASYLVGLRAAATYRQMAALDLEKSKIVIAENIKKAYYSVMVAEQRVKLLDLNISRMDTALFQTAQYQKQGFVEQLDVNRMQVQMNNLMTEKQKVKNLISLSYQLLKFQMALPLQTEIILKDKLNENLIGQLKNRTIEPVKADERIEYKQLEVSKTLTALNEERYRKGYLPSVSFNGSLGASHSNVIFNPFQRWFGSSALTLGMRIPIYDSGLRKVQVQRQNIAFQKLVNTQEMIKESFDLENNSAQTNLTNGFENLEIQQRNMKLAEDVLRVTRIKYGQGLGTNLEVLNAESDLKQSQNNYFSALYDVLIAKVDLDKAQGNLLKN